jgi:hypothetical protein
MFASREPNFFSGRMVQPVPGFERRTRVPPREHEILEIDLANGFSAWGGNNRQEKHGDG